MVKAAPLFGATPKVTIIKGAVKPSAKPLFASSTVRKRLEVTVEDFRKYSKDEKALVFARNIVLTTNVDNLRYDYVLDIGKQHQEQHERIVSLVMRLSNAPALTETKKDIQAILTLLESAPLEKKWFGKSLNLQEVNQELNNLSAKLKKNTPQLAKVLEDVDMGKKETSSLVELIEPYIIAVSFFSEYKKDNFPSDLFISRLTSLISTQGTLRVNLSQLDSIKQIVINILDTINNIVLTELPMWITSALNATLSKGLTEPLEAQKTTLIQKIKNKIQ